MLVRMTSLCESETEKKGEENFTPASGRANIALRCAPWPLWRLLRLFRLLPAARQHPVGPFLPKRSSSEHGQVGSPRLLPGPGRSSYSPRPRWAGATVGEGPAPTVSTVQGSFSGPGVPWGCAYRVQRTRSPPSSTRCISTKSERATSSGGRDTWGSTRATAGSSRPSMRGMASCAGRRPIRTALSVRRSE